MYRPVKQTKTAEAQQYPIVETTNSVSINLSQLCSEGKLLDLKDGVRKGADIDEVDSIGNSLTHTAVINNHLEILEWLVKEKEMDVNQSNGVNRTVLLIAIETKKLSIIEWLVENRQSIKLNVTIDDLCGAVVTDNIEIVKLIVKCIKNICQKSTTGKTPIELARDRSNKEIETFLAIKSLIFILRENSNELEKMQKLRQHVDYQTSEVYNSTLKQPIQNGDTRNKLPKLERIPVVMFAAEQQLIQIVKWLVEKGANPNTSLKSGSTLLAEIKWDKDPQNFKWLVSNGADIYSKDHAGNFAIEKYVNEDNVDMLEWATKEKKFDVTKNNKNGISLMVTAITKGKADIVKLFLRQLPQNVINMKLSDDKTFLHLATSLEYINIVKNLIEFNAEINVEDKLGKTPIDVAVERKNESIIEILIISYAIRIIHVKNLTEEEKIDKLKAIYSKYGYNYMLLQGADDSSRNIIHVAMDLKLEKLAKWLQRNATGTPEGAGPDLKEYNLLLIGETGVGKSTFINAFVNYINFNSLDEAVKSDELYCLIPSSFAITDDNYNRHVITFGEDDNEVFIPGQSSTQSIKSYSITTDTTILRLIDTPGIGDTRGIEKDRENFDQLLKVIAELENIHAICVMLKPNNARLSVLFEYCIRELFAHLDKSASQNIVFLFTNSRGTFYRPGDSFPPLLQILKDLESPPTSVKIPCNKSNVFCMDNESFRFLLARRKGVVFNEEEIQDFSASWNKSSQICRSLVQYLIKMKPHKIQNSVTINAARRLVSSLSKPLTEVAEHIYKTTMHLQEKTAQIERNKGNIEELRKNLDLEVPFLKIQHLNKPFTGCLNKLCAKSYQVLGAWHYIPRECHDPCTHGGIWPNSKGHSSVRYCSKIKMWCEVCRHSFKDHIHLYYKKQVTLKKLEDANLSLTLDRNTLDQTQIANIKRKLETLYDQYKEEEDTILKAMSKFSHFLKHNSIIVFNDVCKDYIVELIEEEEKLGVLKNPALLQTYENILSKYNTYFQDLENKFKRTGDVAVTTTDVFTEMDKLHNLKVFGETVRKLSDAQMGLQKADALRDTKVVPRNITFATFISSVQ